MRKLAWALPLYSRDRADRAVSEDRAVRRLVETWEGENFTFFTSGSGLLDREHTAAVDMLYALTNCTSETGTRRMDRMRELAMKAMKKSGNRFYDNMQKMTHAHLKLKDTVSLDCDDNHVQELQDIMIWEHIELYFRFYAKEIEKPKKRSKRTTNYDIVQTLIKDKHVKFILDTIFLHFYIEACYEEVERRIESAEASEYWDDDSNQSRVEEWTHRYEMMDFAMESWEEGCDYAINNWTDLDQHEFMEIEH